MKQTIIKSLMLIAVLLTSNATYAYDFESGGVLYNITSASEPYTVAVTYKYDGEVVHNYYKGSVTIPEKVTYNGITYSVTEIDAAFADSYYLTSVTIPASILKIGGYIDGAASFSGCSSLISINVSDDNPNFCSIDGVLYSKDKKTLIAYPGAKGNEYTIPEGTILIDEFAFNYCRKLTSVTLPQSIEDIGRYAFEWCEKLKDINFPQCITNIGDYAFKGCRSFEIITLPNSVISIGNGAFWGCDNITSLTLPNSVINIGNDAFWSCGNITSLIIPESVQTLGIGAFNYCTSLKTVYYNAKKCIATGDGYGIFGNSSITDVVIGENVQSIPRTLFYSCVGLKSITIPESVTTIGEYAFDGCSGLTGIYISDIEAWCKIDFRNSYANPLYYAKNLYLNNEKVTNLVIPNTVNEIKDYTFKDCTGLTSVTIPNSVTSIGEYAFSGCSGLTSVTIGNSVTSIGILAFYNCTGLTSITIPNSVTTIGKSAFYGCSGLTSITIPNSVTSIGGYAFLNCTGLTSVTIGNSVTSIGDAAFEGCSNLTEILSLAKTPAYAESETFYAINSNVILYVPEGSKEAYSTAQAWSDFPTIVEIPTNTLSMPSVELYKGKTVTVPVSLSNLDKFTAFQCDLTLPDGVTCSKVTLSDRASDHTITKSQYSDNVVRIASISFTSSPFSGNDGILFNIELTETESFTEGQYEISLKNIKFSTIDAEEYNLPETTATLTMKTYIKGDANGDGSITITDAVAVVNYVMGNIPASFVFDAADINESGDISITDAVGTVNLLLSQSVSTTSISTQNNTKSIISPKVEITTEGNSLYMQDFTVIPGTENTVYLYMDNSTDYTAFSTDIHFPQGITVTSKKLCSERVSDHMMSSSTPAENVLRLAALSFTNAPFTGVSGDPIVELTISVDENFTGGTITINNAELSTASMDYCRPDETTAVITLDITDGVNDITEDSATSVEYYDLQGVRVENPEKGVYIKRQGGKTSKVVM